MPDTLNHMDMTFSQFLAECQVRGDQRTCDMVADACDPDRHLTCPEESELRQGMMNQTEPSEWLSDVNLESVKFLQRHAGARPNKVDYGKLRHPGSSASNQPFHTPAIRPTLMSATSPLDAVIVIQIFRPTDSKKSSAISVDMEIEVLSSQTLMDLRLSICCASDLDTNISPPECRKSAYFFIGDTFYNDMRPGCTDYSKTIIRWSRTPGRGIGPFDSKDMASARMSELPFQLGYPYLYVHQGDCEHWIVFKDRRLATGSGPYPNMTPVGRRVQVKCDICHTNIARCANRDNMRMPADPSFFCDDCNRSFNFDKEDRQIGNFTSQSFVDKSVLL